jgi:hypothetical protein
VDPNEPLPAYAWPGGYPIVYLDTENETLCAECASKPGYTWPVTSWFVHYEGPDEYCSDCNVAIPSAYGDPDEATE